MFRYTDEQYSPDYVTLYKSFSTYPINRFTEFIEIRSERAVKRLICIRPQTVACGP